MACFHVELKVYNMYAVTKNECCRTYLGHLSNFLLHPTWWACHFYLAIVLNRTVWDSELFLERSVAKKRGWALSMQDSPLYSVKGESRWQWDGMLIFLIVACNIVENNVASPLSNEWISHHGHNYSSNQKNCGFMRVFVTAYIRRPVAALSSCLAFLWHSAFLFLYKHQRNKKTPA